MAQGGGINFWCFQKWWNVALTALRWCSHSYCKHSSGDNDSLWCECHHRQPDKWNENYHTLHCLWEHKRKTERRDGWWKEIKKQKREHSTKPIQMLYENQVILLLTKIDEFHYLLKVFSSISYYPFPIFARFCCKS